MKKINLNISVPSVKRNTSESLLRSINKHYSNRFIDNRINRMKVDNNKLNSLSENQKFVNVSVASIKYGINIFNNKEAFMSYYGKESYGRTKKELEKMWSQYEHRYKLMETGQYTEYREDTFKSNYIKMAKGSGITEEDLLKLSSLSGQQIADLVKAGMLPQLGSYSYPIQGITESSINKKTEASEWFTYGLTNVKLPEQEEKEYETYKERYNQGRYKVSTTKLGRKYIRGLRRKISDYLLDE